MSLGRTLLFYLVLIVSTLSLGSLAVISVMVSHQSHMAHRCARLWGNVNLWAAGVVVEVLGLHNIDLQSSYIYAANHQSWFDIFAILGKLPVQFRWLAKIELFKIPVLGQAMAAAGYIPIDRTNRRKAFESMNVAANRIREGTSIVIFPEGTRSLDGTLQGFKKGGFILAIQSQRPLVPISISGTHRILPKLGEWRIHPGHVKMTIGKPISTAGVTTKDRDSLIRQVRQAIRTHLLPHEGGSFVESPDSPAPEHLSTGKR